VDQQRPARHVRYLEHLAGRDARLHERRDVYHEAEAREPASALEPSAEFVSEHRDALAVMPWMVSPGASGYGVWSERPPVIVR
jgi:hypothetical protein